MNGEARGQSELPAVSVVIPAYNDCQRLLVALEALAAQTYPHELFEVVVADNGSSDDTLGRVREFKAGTPVSVVVVQELAIQSSYAARNKALSVASGDVIAFTDSDCIPTHDWLAAGVGALGESSSLAAGGAIEFFYAGNVATAIELLDSGSKLS